MGPMMGGSTGGDPLLIILVMLLAVLVFAALAVTSRLRSGGPGRNRGLPKPSPGEGGNRPVRTEAGEDPLVILRERYARGEISYAEFLHVLDQLLPAGTGQEQGRVPSGAVPGSLA